MSQVHRKNITRVPNALRGRDEIDLCIFAMEGVPLEMIQERVDMKVKEKRKKI